MSDIHLLTRRRPTTILAGAALVVALGIGSHARAETEPAPAPGEAAAARASSRRLVAGSWKRSGDRYFAELAGGASAELTLEPRLQEAAEEVLAAFAIPYGAAVVLSVPDGRVLALVGRSSVAPALGPEELALQPWAPAASVFKVVSAAALVAEGGLGADSRTCYHGGVSAVLPDNLVDLPRLDRTCGTLAYGVGKSQNAIIAKLAARHLTPEKLERTARALGFDQEIPFDLPVEPSTLDVPADPLEFARTAAGFWHSTLSPMHGALLAAAVASGGEMPAPRLIERATGSGHQPLAIPVTPPRAVLAPAVAREVGRMMELTTRIGTAKGTFRDRRGRPVLPVSVAGKTGTLSAETDKGHVGYSWFVGYAPTDRPQIAFAVVLGNPPIWRIKATYLARRLIAETFSPPARDRGTPSLVASARR
jgi:cell division protein FtsI/penicillin-binding protein 2